MLYILWNQVVQLVLSNGAPLFGIRTTAISTTATGQLPPGQLSPRTSATKERIIFPHLFHVFVCSAMKKNTLLRTGLKITLMCC